MIGSWTAILVFLAWQIAGLAQTPENAPAIPPAKPSEAVGGGSAAAFTVSEPGLGSASVRETDNFQLRTVVPSILGWKVSVAVAAFQQLTFEDAAGKADALSVSSIEGSDSLKVSAKIPKSLDPGLAPGELKAVRDRLRALNLRMPLYSVSTVSSDEREARKLFQFAKSLAVETIVVERAPELLTMVGKLAEEYGIDVAICGETQSVLTAIENSQSKRVGACGNTAEWMKSGVKPVEAIGRIKGQLRVLQLLDRSALGHAGSDVILGHGAEEIAALLNLVYAMHLKPTVVVEPAGGADPFTGLSLSLAGFEKAVQPVAAARVLELSKTVPIKGPERLAADLKTQIQAALPAQPAANPKRPRKLLVFDLNVNYGGVNGGHTSIPAANFAIDLMGKKTGIYKAVFSNDLDNFRYNKLHEFDAVFLNNTVGMVFVDPEIRDSLLRFVREGGGLAAYHGASYASMDWTEFGEMLGARQGHAQDNAEIATVKIGDPLSPLTAPFGGREFVLQDEYYRFDSPPYSRDKLHVLLTMDIEKTDLNQGRGCLKPCVRADNDYALGWIRSFGRGRVFYCALGHNPSFFATPPLVDFMLRGIQFALGDLDADTTPSARVVSGKGKQSR